MINVKKGPAHSLGQADIRGTWDGSTAFVAGQVAMIDANGVVQKGAVANAGTPGLAGLVIDGPVTAGAVAGVNAAVNESGKIALYTFDGASVIETDQASPAITAANYPIGSAVYAFGAGAAAGNIGLITNATGTKVSSTVIGWVEGIRTLQKDANNTFTGQAYTQINRDTGAQITSNTFAYKGQTNISVVAIKLASVGALAAAAA